MTVVTLRNNFVYEYEDTSMDDPAGWKVINSTKSVHRIEMTRERAEDVISYCQDRMGMGVQGFELNAGRLRSLKSGMKAVAAAFNIELEED